MTALRRRRATTAAFIVLTLAALAACTASTAAAPSPTADPTKDKLAQVLQRGTLVLWTDPDYAPQSFKVDGAVRAANTRCEANQMTAPEVSGYDAETGKLVAEALGVEPCFVTAPFDSVIAGNWGDHWDVAWGSGALTADRMKHLYMTQPYYSTPANFFVAKDSPVTKAEELSGKEIGACAGCTHEMYLKRTLELPGETIDFVVDNPKIETYNSEPPGLADVAAGKLVAFLCSQPVGAAEIKKGAALKMLDAPAFYTQKTGYLDRGSAFDQVAFMDRVNAAIRDLHAKGTLEDLSTKFFGTDYATPAASFDLAGVGQQVP